MKPEISRLFLASMQVCVPSNFTDEQVRQFADTENPTGLDHGWEIRREGDPALAGCAERVPCAQRAGCVHLMLDC